MAAAIKQLAKETAVYGLSSIVGRVLNWMLVPMYVRVLDGTAQYGIVTELYAWTALLLAVLTYGMETGFFRFVNKPDEAQPMRVYGTILYSLATTSTLFAGIVLALLTPISQAMSYADHPEYIGMMAVIVAIDAFCALPFAYLRYRNRPIRFAIIKLTNIGLTIALNLFFLLACPAIYEHAPSLIDWFYRPDWGAGYIFVANLIATLVTAAMLLPYLLPGLRAGIDRALLKRIVRYSFPILILSVAGILNQSVDKMLFKFLFADRAYAMEQLGIYGACFKIAVIMVMFIQAFRYAYEPFVFARHKTADNRAAYAVAMKYFIIFALIIFLGVMFYIDIVKRLIPPAYYGGLQVVPIVMLGELFFGIYFNLSVWYKLIDRTQWGALFSLIGCATTVGIIVVFAPRFGFMACAWASLASNLLMMLLSYFIGQRRFAVQYDLRSAAVYALAAAAMYAAGMLPTIESEAVRLGYRTLLLAVFVGWAIRRDVPLKTIPFISNNK